MNFKLRALVVGALMTATLSTNAIADIVRPSTGNGSELILNVYTMLSGSETSFSLDTGITLTAFYAAVASGDTSAFTRTMTSSYTNWYNALSADQKASTQWNFVGGETLGEQNFITTQTRSPSTVITVPAQTDDHTRSMGLSLDTLIASINTVSPGTSTSANDSITAASKTSAGYAGNFDGNWSGNLKYGFASADIGTDLDLYKITAQPFDAETSVFAKLVAPSNLQMVAQFDGTTFSIAAVPEADTSAMMIAGIGLMGFIARRRKFNKV
jgi:hypothetical protein